jgi:hypothetical protein
MLKLRRLFLRLVMSENESSSLFQKIIQGLKPANNSKKIEFNPVEEDIRREELMNKLRFWAPWAAGGVIGALTFIAWMTYDHAQKEAALYQAEKAYEVAVAEIKKGKTSGAQQTLQDLGQKSSFKFLSNLWDMVALEKKLSITFSDQVLGEIRQVYQKLEETFFPTRIGQDAFHHLNTCIVTFWAFQAKKDIADLKAKLAFCTQSKNSFQELALCLLALQSKGQKDAPAAFKAWHEACQGDAWLPEVCAMGAGLPLPQTKDKENKGDQA